MHERSFFRSSPLPCGFPSPADDYAESSLDLNELVITHPSATFYVRVSGDSMRAALFDGDILVVDRALEAAHNSIIVAYLDGKFTVKRLQKQGDSIFLVPDNPAYTPIIVSDDVDFEVWGVVTHCIHRLI